MGRYIDWSDAVDRYPALDTLGGSDEGEPTHIQFAEAYIDSQLATFYTIPFSSNNMTVRDLVIDDVYYRAGRFKFEDAAAVHTANLMDISALKKGKVGMVTLSGELISARKLQGGYSSTQSYHSAFGVRPIEEQHIDHDNITAERGTD